MLLIDKNRTKTRNNLVLKVKDLKLKREIEQAAEATKVKEELVENLSDSHFKSFVLFASVADLVSVLVNVSKKGENLLDRDEVVEILFAISIDVTYDILSDTTDDENDRVFLSRIMIRIDE